MFLGRDFVKERDFSEETASAVDKAIHRLLEDAYSDAKKTMIEHREILVAISEELFERETLDAEEIDDIIRKHGGGDLIPPKKENPPSPPPARPLDATTTDAKADESNLGDMGPGEMVPGTA